MSKLWECIADDLTGCTEGHSALYNAFIGSSSPTFREANNDERKCEGIDMQKVTLEYMSFVATSVMLGSVFAVAQQGEPQIAPKTIAERSLTGTVTCTGRITHQYTCQRNQTLQTCTLACVERGSEFALMVVDKPYVLEGDRRIIEAYAGGKATVTGLVTDDHIQVHTVSNAKKIP